MARMTDLMTPWDSHRRYLVTTADGTTAEGTITAERREPGRTDVTMGALEHEINYVTEIREVGAPMTEFRPPEEPTDPETEAYLYAPDGTTTGPFTRNDDGEWQAAGVFDNGISWENVLMLACSSGATVRWSTPLAPGND